MAKKLAEATLVLTLDDKQYKLALSQIPKQAEEAANSVKSISQAVNFAVFKELATIASNAFRTVIDGLVELGNRGANVDDVANSFEVLTERTGESADVMLGKLREGVVGTLSDFDLMVLANKTLGSGLVKTSDDMGVLAAGARTLAKATGQTTKEAFDTLTTAMASGRTASLKQVGLFVDSKVALEAYSAVIHKNVADFTDADRAQALAAASLEALRGRMKEIKPDAADFGELIDQAKVRLENFRDQVAVAVAKSPVFAAGMNTMGKALSDAFGSDNKAQAAEMTKFIEKVGIGVTYVAQGALVLGSVFATVFSAIGVLVNGALTAVVGFAGGIVTGVDALARLQASLPFASDGAKQLAAITGDLRTRMDAMTISLANSTAEAAKGVVGQGALHEKLDAMGGVVMRVRDAMTEAQGKTAETTKAVVELGKAAPETAGRSQDAADKIAAAFRDLNAEIVIGTKVGLDKRLAEIDAARVKELDGLKAFKFESDAQHDQMEALIEEKYRQRVAAATLAGDEIKAKEQQVQNDIALLTTTGTENKLLQIQIARDKEIESLAFLKLSNEQRYAEDVAAVNEKYRIQTEAAQGYYATIELAAAAAGFKTRAELQTEADNAKRLYSEMLASGKFTQDELEKAHKKSTDAQMALDGQRVVSTKEMFAGIASAATSILRDLFGKNKAAAIAATAIDAAAAIVKAFAQGGILGFASAAAIAAATAKQIVTIKSAQPDGFAQGTPNLDFADFGAESFQPLHNQEAVIPRGGGHVLAGEIAEAMPGQDEQLSLLRRLVDAAERAPAETRKAFRNALILDMA